MDRSGQNGFDSPPQRFQLNITEQVGHPVTQVTGYCLTEPHYPGQL